MPHFLPPIAVPSASACHAELDADTSAEWNGLWLHMVKAHAGVTTQSLRYQAVNGWCLTDETSAQTAALFALYKPLLDARVQHRNDAQAAPWVMAQMGQSLDGFIATSTGDSFFVNGEPCLLHLHRLRALCDAVLVGAGTVAIDNPQLTTRKVPGTQPTRVVIDAQARLDGRSRVFQDGQAPTLWVSDALYASIARQRLDALATDACEVLAVEGLLDGPAPGCFRPQRVIDALAVRGLRLLFVEGGGVTVSRFFTSQALDRLHLAIAPVFIGQGRRGLQAQANEVMAECLRPAARTLAMGNDMLWDMTLRPPTA